MSKFFTSVKKKGSNIMIRSLEKNGARAIADVSASLAGTLVIVGIISYIVSLQSDTLTTTSTFSTYFQGGQIGLPILSLSGIIFIAILRHDRRHPIHSLALYFFFLVPFMATAFLIGFNPGFIPDQLSTSSLKLLWIFYVLLHFVWFLVLVFEPTIPTIQEAASDEEDRVRKIKLGATEHE